MKEALQGSSEASNVHQIDTVLQSDIDRIDIILGSGVGSDSEIVHTQLMSKLRDF